MIAIALSCDPRPLIADEPTTALDVTTQAQILDLLRKLQQERGMAIMLITHNLGVVAEMADDVVVMYLGRVVEQGNVDDIFHDPKHPYTKALLQSIPSIESVPRLKLPTISGSIPHPFNRPTGCPFHPRCVSSIPGRCDTEVPQLQAVGEGRRVSCFLYPGLPGPQILGGCGFHWRLIVPGRSHRPAGRCWRRASESGSGHDVLAAPAPDQHQGPKNHQDCQQASEGATRNRRQRKGLLQAPLLHQHRARRCDHVLGEVHRNRERFMRAEPGLGEGSVPIRDAGVLARVV